MINSTGSSFAIWNPSTSTILSSLSFLSFWRILSNPISCTTLPPHSMGLCAETSTTPSSMYFFRRACTNVKGGSGALLGRMKLPALVMAPVMYPNYLQSVIVGRSERCKRHPQSKYFLPACSPECLPLNGSSHSTPNHSPEVPSTEPIYRIVHREVEYETRWLT